MKLWLLRLQNLQGSTAVCIGMTRLLHLEEGHREREAQRADIVQAYAAPYPKWMISKVLGAHRKNRKVSRVLQIAVTVSKKTLRALSSKNRDGIDESIPGVPADRHRTAEEAARQRRSYEARATGSSSCL